MATEFEQFCERLHATHSTPPLHCLLTMYGATLRRLDTDEQRVTTSEVEMALRMAVCSRGGIVDVLLPDGTLRVLRGCCAFGRPDANGHTAQHVGDHGWQPYWARIGDGDWTNLPQNFEQRLMKHLLLVPASDSTTEALAYLLRMY